MGDPSAPSPPAAAAAGGAGATVPVSTATTAPAEAPSVARAAASTNTAPGSTATRIPRIPRIPAQSSHPDRPLSEPRLSTSRDGQQQEPDQDQDQALPQQQQQLLQDSQDSHTPSTIAHASASKSPHRRSFFSRLSLPFRPPARTIADFHIRPAEPHRTYVAGDHVLGAVVLTVVKPVRIAHLTVSLRGLVRVFRDPNAAATAQLPADTATGSSSSATSRLLSGKPSSGSASSSSSYLGNGHALLFRDEMVLSGPGRLEPGNYEFEFDLIFPPHNLPSSIDFERGSICYVVTATLTRPTAVAPTQSCDRRIFLVNPVDIGAVPKPRPRIISLEPISKRSKKRKIVIVTQPPRASQDESPAGMHAEVPNVRDTMSTISITSGGGNSDQHDIVTLSECGSALDSPLETMQTEDTEPEGYAEAQLRAPRTSQPRSPIPADTRSEIGVESAASGGSGNRSGNTGGGFLNAAAGSGSGSGSGFGFGSARGSGSGAGIDGPTGSNVAASTAVHSAATTTGTNTSSSTITNPAAGNSGNGQRHQSPEPTRSMSTTTISGTADDRTITATVDLLKGGCLRGEVVSVKVSVQHVKRIKSLHGVVVTLYRQGRIDSAPPESMFSTAGPNLAKEINEFQGNDTGALDEGVPEINHDGSDGQAQTQGRKTKKSRRTDDSSKAKQKVQPKEKERDQQPTGSKDDNGSGKGSTKVDNYYPKSKTGLGGLSLMSAGTCSVFRKDLSQSFSPLIIDPRTLQSSVTASVRMPEDAFATIKGVPGDMISFKYQLEVIVDLGGKLASLLQSGVGPAGPNLVSKSGNPYDGKPTTTSAVWGGGSHMIETDQLRRQKGVIYVAFEVVVGTTDTTRQRSRGVQGVPDGLRQENIPRQESQLQPQPYEPHNPPDDRYPEDRKDPRQHRHDQQRHELYPGWPVNEIASDSHAAAGPSTVPAGVFLDGSNYHLQYHPYAQQAGLEHYDDSGSRSIPAVPNLPYNSRGSFSDHAPQYIPTAEMLAAERDPNLSEKERIHRAEQRLLPSQPARAASAPNGGEGSSGSTASRHAPSAPSAPSLDEVEAPSMGSPLVLYGDNDLLGSSQAPTEDKQELERRRLLAEASAPPDFPDDYYDDSGPNVGSSSAAGMTRVHAVGAASSRDGSPAGPSYSSSSLANAAPSAPVLEEEDAHHHHYCQSSAYRPGSSGLPAQESGSSSTAPPPVAQVSTITDATAPSALPAEPFWDDDTSTPLALSAPLAEDVESVAPATTDEDRYGRNYTYGPRSSPEASSSRATEQAEPLPKYER
ncbi:ph-response sensor protein [Sporothrix epigloea]|uniref:Ph-response sensor protein n=1 Tax=Sporothrix epigloea TaxID=1892477 RepID=A0ABP0D694_9PEZI